MSKEQTFISRLAASGLCGRGGAGYPAAAKWEAVKAALGRSGRGYIIVNAAEDEPGVKKDAWVLEHGAAELVSGLEAALHYLGPDKIIKVYFFASRQYERLLAPGLAKVLAGRKHETLRQKWKFFAKPERPAYISGEETAILNIIEGRRAEPRLKPPYPTVSGLYHHPTLISNAETFYSAGLVAQGRYHGERLYTIGGDVKHRGVFSLPAAASAEEILRATHNYPEKDFFVIAGGSVCGEVWRSDQLQAPVEGSGLLLVMDGRQTKKRLLLERWLKFYEQESCGACTACREGTYRLRELFSQKDFDRRLFEDLLDNLESSSRCALGAGLAGIVKSLENNIK